VKVCSLYARKTQYTYFQHNSVHHILLFYDTHITEVAVKYNRKQHNSHTLIYMHAASVHLASTIWF